MAVATKEVAVNAQEGEGICVRSNGDFAKGWQKCGLLDFCDLVMGQSPPSATYNTQNKGLPFYQGKSEFGLLYPTPEKSCSAPNKIAEQGDILLSVRAPVGPTNLAPHKCCIGRGLSAIRPLGSIEKKFILFLFRSLEHELSKEGSGTTFKAITKDFLVNLEVNLPPFNEQKRIVSKLEELLSELDKGIESFKTAREQLTVYRQAVLKHAFEGKLTEEWRKKHADELESAETLLEKIKVEREQRYRQQLDDWKQAVKAWEAGGKAGKKPTKPAKPKELQPLTEAESTKLPALPKEWKWVTIPWILSLEKKGMTTGPFGTLLKKANHEASGIPVLGIENIGEGKFLKGNKIFVTEEKARELEAFRVDGKDIIISRSGTVGEICIVPTGLGHALISTNLIRVSLNGTAMDSAYFVYLFLGGGSVKDQVKELCKGSTREFLNQSILSSIYFPIPPIIEQHQIIQEIESRLSVAEKLEQDIEYGLKQAEALRQSLLKKAFEGRLVPQEPNDEPASVLLERIKTEKAKLKKNARKEKKVAV